jgi:hypothetical protein
MFIVYDQTSCRVLNFSKNAGDKFPVLWEASQDDPVSVFRTRKSAEAAITATTGYTFVNGSGRFARTETPSWTRNSYVVLPVKLERKK